MIKQELHVFENAQALVDFFNQGNISFLSLNEAQLLLDYMEGHDYILAYKGEQLFRVDVSYDHGEIDEYSFSQLVLCVSDWNDSMLEPLRELCDCSECDIEKRTRYLADEAVLDTLCARTLSSYSAHSSNHEHKTYKVCVYYHAGTDKGNLKEELFFDTLEECVEIWDAESKVNYSTRPTIWIKTANDYARVLGF